MFKILSFRALVIAVIFIAIEQLNAQTIGHGSIAVISVNADNSGCGGTSDEDEIKIAFLRDIPSGQSFVLTDNGYGMVSPTKWGDTEGTIRITNTSTIAKGQIVTFTFDGGSYSASPGSWTFDTSLNANQVFNLNSTIGDQVILLKDGIWANGFGVGSANDATYSEEAFFGVSTTGSWNGSGTGENISKSPPFLVACALIGPWAPSLPNNHWMYNGPFSATSSEGWFSRIANEANWISTTCTGIANTIPTTLSISPDPLGISCISNCDVCNGGQPTFELNLPSSGSFTAVVSDGTTSQQLTNVSDGHTFTWSGTISGNITIELDHYIDGFCTIEGPFDLDADITLLPPIEVDDIPDITVCEEFIIPAITGTNLQGNEAVYSQPNGAGSPISGPITTSGTYYIYGGSEGCNDEESFSITVLQPPVITNPGPQEACTSFNLPAITGTDIPSNAGYFLSPGGVNPAPNPFTTLGITTIYIFADNGGSCSDEVSFTVEIFPVVDVDDIPDVTVCPSYNVPTVTGSGLSGNEAIYAQSGGVGSPITGTITTSGTYYIYDENADCNDEESFSITVLQPPVITNPGPQEACTSFNLPAITGTDIPSNAGYFLSPGGVNPAPNPFTTLGITTIYIFADNGDSCSDEVSFTVEIFPVVDVDDIPDVTVCPSYNVPTVTGSGLSGNEAIYAQSGGVGSPITGTITTSGTYYIYDENADCNDEESFSITVLQPPVITNPGPQEACTSFNLPAITGTDIPSNAGYFLSPGGVNPAPNPFTTLGITTIYIFADNGSSCSDEVSFTVEIFPVVDVDDIPDVTVCPSYNVPTVTGSGLSGNEAIYAQSGGVGSPITGTITTSGTYYIYDENADCNDEESFSITVLQPPVITNPGPQEACTSFNLPAITGTDIPSNAGYFLSPGGVNPAPNPFTTLGITTIYIFADNGDSCSDEVSFTVEIFPVVDVDDIPDVTVCPSYNVPTVTGSGLSGNEAIYAQSGGVGSPITGTITTSGTYYIYDENADCNDEESFSITVLQPPVITNPGPQEACTSFNLPAITGTDIPSNAGYFLSPGGINPAPNPFTTLGITTIYIFADNGSSCSDEVSFTVEIFPVVDVDDIPDVTVCPSYNVPAVTGSGLSGNEAIYAQSGGVGSPITGTITTSGTYYIYDENADCNDEESFSITVLQPPVINNLGDVDACNTYTFPAITGSHITGTSGYFTESGGAGTEYNPGEMISSTGIMTIYIFVDNDFGCTAEESFVLEITPGMSFNPMAPVQECASYMLPTITGSNLTGNEAYYTLPNGNGIQFNAGDIITNSYSPLYIFGGSEICNSETSFDVVISPPPALNSVSHVTACSSYELPEIIGTNLPNNVAYYDGPNGTGNAFIPGEIIFADMLPIYIFADYGDGCSDEISFNITIVDEIEISQPAHVVSCDEYILPTISGINLSGNEMYYSNTSGTGTSFNPGHIFNSSNLISPLFIYDENEACNDEVSFNIDILDKPIIDEIDDVTICGVYNLPIITGSNLTLNANYYLAPNGVGSPVSTISNLGVTTVYAYDISGTDCFDEVSFNVTILEGPILFPIQNMSSCSEVILPEINGTNLSGNEAYFTGSQGSGVMFLPGHIITESTILYVYDRQLDCFDELQVEIIIDGTPDAQSTSMSACLENGFATFALTTLEPIITNNLNLDVYWYLDTLQNTLVSDPFSFQTADDVILFVRIGDVNCLSNATPIYLSVTEGDYGTFQLDCAGMPNGDCNFCSSEIVDILSLSVGVGFNYCFYLTVEDDIAGTSHLEFCGEPYFDILVEGSGLVTIDSIKPIGGGCKQTINLGTPLSWTKEKEITLDIISDVSTCGYYVLPEVTGINIPDPSFYYSESLGNGDSYSPGDTIKSDILPIYFYANNGQCDTEISFDIEITQSAEISATSEINECNYFILQTIMGASLPSDIAYYSQPNGTGIVYSVGDTIKTSITPLYIYSDGNGSCAVQDSFDIHITQGTIIDTFEDITTCDFFILPDIIGSNLSGNESFYDDKNGNGNSFNPGDTIFNSITLYAFDQVNSCLAEQEFNISIVDHIDASFSYEISCMDMLSIIPTTQTPGGKFRFVSDPGNGMTIDSLTGEVNHLQTGDFMVLHYFEGDCAASYESNISIVEDVSHSGMQAICNNQDQNFYFVIINAFNHTDLTVNAGTPNNDPGNPQYYEITNIPISTPLVITISNDICEEVVHVDPPTCNCPTVSPPDVNGADKICFGASSLWIATYDTGLNIEWLNSSGQVIHNGDSLIISDTELYHVRTVDKDGCKSDQVAVQISIENEPTFNVIDTVCNGLIPTFIISSNAIEVASSEGIVSVLGNSQYSIALNTNQTQFNLTLNPNGLCPKIISLDVPVCEETCNNVVTEFSATQIDICACEDITIPHSLNGNSLSDGDTLLYYIYTTDISNPLYITGDQKINLCDLGIGEVQIQITAVIGAQTNNAIDLDHTCTVTNTPLLVNTHTEPNIMAELIQNCGSQEVELNLRMTGSGPFIIKLDDQKDFMEFETFSTDTNVIVPIPSSNIITIYNIEDLYCSSSPNIELIIDELVPDTIYRNEQICESGQVEINGSIYDKDKLSGFEILPNIDPILCDTILIVTLEIIELEFSLSGTEATCENSEDGTITINEINSLSGEYDILINGTYIQKTRDFPLTFDSLLPSNYDIQLVHESGCIWEQSLTVTSGANVSLDLGPDQFLIDENSVFIPIQTNIEGFDMIWESDASIDCDDCEEGSLLTVHQSSVHYLTIWKGVCSATDSVYIDLTKNNKLFVPNAFSPNNDGSNDFFTAYTNDEKALILTVKVFNRWGDRVYDYSAPKEILLQDYEGWDGTWRAQEAGEGTYAYVIQIKWSDGNIENAKGELNLIR